MEPHSHERPTTYRSRTKLGLETPISGWLWRERRLIFSPPRWYDILTWACLVFGAYTFCSAILPVYWLPRVLGEEVDPWLGPLVFFAGLWGMLSSERLTCDLKKRTYARREGQSMFKRRYTGSLDELDAIVLVAQQYWYPTPASPAVIYRLVLHWKGSRQPLLIVERETAGLRQNQPLNAGAGRLAALGQTYARLLGIKFFDNSYFHSPEPLPPV